MTQCRTAASMGQLLPSTSIGLHTCRQSLRCMHCSCKQAGPRHCCFGQCFPWASVILDTQRISKGNNASTASPRLHVLNVGLICFTAGRLGPGPYIQCQHDINTLHIMWHVTYDSTAHVKGVFSGAGPWRQAQLHRHILLRILAQIPGGTARSPPLL